MIWLKKRKKIDKIKNKNKQIAEKLSIIKCLISGKFPLLEIYIVSNGRI